jgi:hypothetical protein
MDDASPAEVADLQATVGVVGRDHLLVQPVLPRTFRPSEEADRCVHGAGVAGAVQVLDGHQIRLHVGPPIGQEGAQHGRVGQQRLVSVE